MKLPVIEGIIRRRILLNYRVDPHVIGELRRPLSRLADAARLRAALSREGRGEYARHPPSFARSTARSIRARHASLPRISRQSYKPGPTGLPVVATRTA